MDLSFEAAWIPFEAGRDPEVADEAACEWAEARAATQDGPVVLVSDNKGDLHDHPVFARYRNGRRATPRSSRLGVRPGAVVAYRPTPQALALAMRLAHGTALSWRSSCECRTGCRDGQPRPARWT